MTSPFPGMDPYLETRWGDVHASLTVYARDALNGSLPSGLMARADERSIVAEAYHDKRDIYPDVFVLQRGSGESSVLNSEAEIAESRCLLLLEPTIFKQRYLEIRDASSGGRVITVIEFVSPTNKRPGDGLEKYLQKHTECLDAGVNFVEIDLTCGGDRSLIMPIQDIALEGRSTYAATLRRVSDPKHVWLFNLPIQKRLGAIPIPLRKSDQDSILNLQSIVDKIYNSGRYASDLDYQKPLANVFSDSDTVWINNILKERQH